MIHQAMTISELDMALASGIAAFEAKEFRRAMPLLTPLAEQGDPGAQFRVAMMYQNGLGMVANEQQAYHWMRRAAEQNYGFAPFRPCSRLRPRTGLVSPSSRV